MIFDCSHINICLICRKYATCKEHQHSWVTATIACRRCGNYFAPENTFLLLSPRPDIILSAAEQGKISGWVREQYIHYERNAAASQLPGITTKDYPFANCTAIEDIVQIAPKTAKSCLDKLLLNLAFLADGPGKAVGLNEDDYPLAYAQDVGEFLFYLNELKSSELAYINSIPMPYPIVAALGPENYAVNCLVTLSIKGQQRVEELRTHMSKPKSIREIQIELLQELYELSGHISQKPIAVKQLVSVKDLDRDRFGMVIRGIGIRESKLIGYHEGVTELWLTDKGVDAVENPNDANTGGSYPVNHSVNIHAPNANLTNLQINSANSSITSSTTAPNNSELVLLAEQLISLLQEQSANDDNKEEMETYLKAIKQQLNKLEPNFNLVNEAGRSLRSITENIAANLLQPAFLVGVHQLVTSLPHH